VSRSIVYCMDSSALTDLRMLYRRSTFPGVWKDLANLVDDRRLMSPREVWKEIKKDNELPLWVRERNNRRMFVQLNAKGLQVAKEISNNFQGLVDTEKETPDADPFVIALAIQKHCEPQGLFHSQNYVVLTSERPNPQGKPRIPDVCRLSGVECLSGSRALADLFEREGWHY